MAWKSELGQSKEREWASRTECQNSAGNGVSPQGGANGELGPDGDVKTFSKEGLPGRGKGGRALAGGGLVWVLQVQVEKRVLVKGSMWRQPHRGRPVAGYTQRDGLI